VSREGRVASSAKVLKGQKRAEATLRLERERRCKGACEWGGEVRSRRCSLENGEGSEPGVWYGGPITVGSTVTREACRENQ